jgi:hypothetical protein
MFYVLILCIVIGLLEAKEKMVCPQDSAMLPSKNLFRFLFNE